MHRPRRHLLALILLVFGLSACGGDSREDQSAPELLAETFGPDKPVRSGRLDLRIAFEAKGLANLTAPLKLSLAGPFASAGKRQLPRFDFDIALDASGQQLAGGAVSTGKQGWVKFAGSSFALDPATFRQFRTLYEEDQKRTAAADSPSFQALGVDPRRWLASPEKAGEESVGGAETIHVTSAVDVPAFLADVNTLLGRADATGAAAATGATGAVPSRLTPEQLGQIERSVKRTSLDVYSGKDDGALRRLNLLVAFAVPPELQAQSGGLTTGSIGLDLVIAQLNEEQAIAAPKGARPLSELVEAVGVTGATGASGPPPAVSARYGACLDEAGDSIAEVQKCAPLLNAP